MKIHMETVGPFQENSYFVTDEHTGSTVIIDPGGDAQKLIRVIESGGFKPRWIMNTHGHIDHLAAARELQEAYRIPFYIHAEDEALVQQAVNYAALFAYPLQQIPLTDRYLEDNMPFTLEQIEIKVLHVPGHTRGGCAFYIPSEKVLFSGDTLFRESVGRTDLPGGDYATIQKSIRQKLFILPEDTTVYPGHGPVTTIGYEKKNNPFVK